MSKPKFKLITFLCLSIAVGTLILVGLGGFVRATGAGLACPDWPLCFDKFLPKLTSGVWQEWTHRFVASIISIATFCLAYVVWPHRKHYKNLWRMLVALVFVLLIQIVLGGLTVLMLLNPFIVTAHLACGTIFFIAVCAIAIDVRRTNLGTHKGGQSTTTLCKWYLVALASIVFCQIILGGFVGTSGAALACLDIPFCNGSIVPENGPQAVQIAHRILGTLIAFLTIAGLVFYKTMQKVGLSKHYLAIVFLILLQVTLGFSNVYFRIPVSITVAHLLVAEVILLIIVSMIIKVFPNAAPVSYSE